MKNAITQAMALKITAATRTWVAAWLGSASTHSKAVTAAIRPR